MDDNLDQLDIDQILDDVDNAPSEFDQLKALRELNKFIPFNDFGLPVGIYRVDLLPFHKYDPSTHKGQSLVGMLAPDWNTNEHGTLEPKQASHASRGESGGVQVRDTAAEIPAEFATFGVMLGKDTFVDEDDLDDLDELEDQYDSPSHAESRTEELQGHDHDHDHERTRTSLVPTNVELPETFGKREDAVEQRIHRTAGFETSALETAFMWLDYSEGFPAFMDGSIFWAPLPHESPSAYKVFEQYLRMSHSKITSNDELIFRDTRDDAGKTTGPGVRSVSMLAGAMHPIDSEFQKYQLIYKEYALMYYWDVRARAYDMFRVAQHRKVQEVRAIELQDSHYIETTKLLDRCIEFINSEEDFWDMMTPKVALDMLKTLMQAQRVSIGLPATGPINERARGDESGVGGYQSTEVIMRKMGQQVRRDDPTVAANTVQDNGSGVIIDEDGQIQTATNLLNNALTDPGATAQLQEIIIRLTKGTSR